MMGYPKGRFKCLICGAIRDNQKYIRYQNPESAEKTVRQVVAELEKYPEMILTAKRHLQVLRKLNPDTEVYNFTVCHGYFVKVK